MELPGREGSDRPYDEMEAHNQNLTFSVLERWFQKRMDIGKVSEDVLKTLGLINRDAFNNAAALLLLIRNLAICVMANREARQAVLSSLRFRVLRTKCIDDLG